MAGSISGLPFPDGNDKIKDWPAQVEALARAVVKQVGITRRGNRDVTIPVGASSFTGSVTFTDSDGVTALPFADTNYAITFTVGGTGNPYVATRNVKSAGSCTFTVNRPSGAATTAAVTVSLDFVAVHY